MPLASVVGLHAMYVKSSTMYCITHNFSDSESYHRSQKHDGSRNARVALTFPICFLLLKAAYGYTWYPGSFAWGRLLNVANAANAAAAR